MLKRFLNILLVIFFLPARLLASYEIVEPQDTPHAFMAQLLLNTSGHPDLIAFCYNYSCKRQTLIHINSEQSKAFKALFTHHTHTPKSERQAISQAVARFEQIAAMQAPVANDKGKNHNDRPPGRLDCFDEASNTTRFLHYLENLDILRWHRVEKPVYRAPWLFGLLGQHWSAHILDTENTHHYAVDSWVRDNGQPPPIQPLEAWKKREPYE